GPRSRRGPRRAVSERVVQLELRRSGTQPSDLDLLIALVADPRLDEVLAEDVADREEVIVLRECVEGLLERLRLELDALQLLRRQLVEVLVGRLRRLDAVLDPVESCHELSREREVRVR